MASTHLRLQFKNDFKTIRKNHTMFYQKQPTRGESKKDSPGAFSSSSMSLFSVLWTSLLMLHLYKNFKIATKNQSTIAVVDMSRVFFSVYYHRRVYTKLEATEFSLICRVHHSVHHFDNAIVFKVPLQWGASQLIYLCIVISATTEVFNQEEHVDFELRGFDKNNQVVKN